MIPHWHWRQSLPPTLKGGSFSSDLNIEIDEIDLRVYLRHDEPKEKAVADASIFKYMAESDRAELLDLYTKHRDHELHLHEEAVAEWKAKNPDKVYKEKPFLEFERTYLKDLHGDDSHGGAHEVKAASGGHESHPKMKIPFSDVKYFSNFGPAKNNFNAIYFTMTGLHGLHVLGGMLVFRVFPLLW